MNKKIIIFGASSFIAQEISNKLRDNYELICISKKKIFNKKIKFIKTNYNLYNIKKILKKNINKKDKPVFIFFNSLSDNKIFIKNSIKEIENIIYVNQLLPILFTNLILKNFFFHKPIFLYISSSRGKKGDKGISLYSTTKNALSSFAKNMAIEYGKFEIIFKVILLGLFKGGLKNKLSNENNKKILKNTFNNSYVEIDQLLKVVEHSIEDTSGNGSEIHCDNGFN